MFRGGEYDIVITDRGMPEISGDQLAAEIQRTAPDMTIIMLTGFGDMMDNAGENPVGVDLILSKPITLAALREAIIRVSS